MRRLGTRMTISARQMQVKKSLDRFCRKLFWVETDHERWTSDVSVDIKGTLFCDLDLDTPIRVQVLTGGSLVDRTRPGVVSTNHF